MTQPPVTGLCEECGFDYASIDLDLDPLGASDTVRGFARRYRAPLTRFLPGEDGDALVRTRPDADTWSAIEYACHVRDVFAVQRERLLRAAVEDCPVLESKGMAAWPERDGYIEQERDAVVDDLARNADDFADAVAGLPAGAGAWPLVYSYPEPAERTIGWLVSHTVHEGHHHLLDVGRVLRAARGR